MVRQDEREGGLRAILNFGHTFGHAIEAGMGYGAWLHGEAVGCGMVMAADLSQPPGLHRRALHVERIRALVRRRRPAGAGARPGHRERWLELMEVDKKNEGGAKSNSSCSNPLGKARASATAPQDVLLQATLAACIGQ